MKASTNTFDKIIKKEIKAIFEKEFNNLKDFYADQLKEFLMSIAQEDIDKNIKECAKVAADIILKDAISEKIDKRLEGILGTSLLTIVRSNEIACESNKKLMNYYKKDDIEMMWKIINSMQTVITGNLSNDRLVHFQ